MTGGGTAIGVEVRQRLVTRIAWLVLVLPFLLGLIEGVVEGAALAYLVALPGTALVGFFAYASWHARLLVEPDRVRKRYVRGWQPAMRFDDVVSVELAAVPKLGLQLSLLSTSRTVLSVDQPSWPIQKVCRVLAPHLRARAGQVEIVDRSGALRRALSA